MTVGSVVAQETATPAATPVSNEEVFSADETIFRKKQQPERIRELFDLYLARVEKHRELDRRFRVSKAQFEKLNTLQSLEEAISLTRDVMISRDEVLITYLELLHASLDDTAGVDVQIKLDTLKNLEKAVNDLRVHLDAVKKTTNREGIATRADEFVVLAEQVSNVAGVARAQIVVGKLQNVYDKTNLIYKQIQQQDKVAEFSALKQQERERAYAEVERALAVAEDQLEATRLEFAAAARGPRFNVGKDLETAYTGIAQLLSFVEELALDSRP